MSEWHIYLGRLLYFLPLSLTLDWLVLFEHPKAQAFS